MSTTDTRAKEKERQPEEQPGMEHRMLDKPSCLAKWYRGTGLLKDKVRRLVETAHALRIAQQ